MIQPLKRRRSPGLAIAHSRSTGAAPTTTDPVAPKAADRGMDVVQYGLALLALVVVVLLGAVR